MGGLGVVVGWGMSVEEERTVSILGVGLGIGANEPSSVLNVIYVLCLLKHIMYWSSTCMQVHTYQ